MSTARQTHAGYRVIGDRLRELGEIDRLMREPGGVRPPDPPPPLAMLARATARPGPCEPQGPGEHPPGTRGTPGTQGTFAEHQGPTEHSLNAREPPNNDRAR